MFLGGDLEHGGNGGMVVLQDVSNVVGDVLVDEDDSDVLAGRKAQEGLLHLLQLGVLLDD